MVRHSGENENPGESQNTAAEKNRAVAGVQKQ